MFGALERQPFVLVSRSSLGLTASSRAGSLPRVSVCADKKWKYQKQQSPRISTRASFCMVRHQESKNVITICK